MKRGFSNSDDESSPTSHQSSKFSKSHANNGRKLTFQLNDSVKDAQTSDSKFKTHQSTPYPKQKLRQLQETASAGDIETIANTAEEIAEKRNPEFLVKLGALNRAFIRWIDIYFNKGYDYDFTPVCNDYIRFINNLKQKYPIENSGSSGSSSNSFSSSLANSLEKASSIINNRSNESSPIKSKLTFSPFNNANAFINTPPPNPGDRDYKSTPYPKHLLSKKQPDSNESGTIKFEFASTTAQQPTPATKFEFLPQQPTKSQEQQDTTPVDVEEKKEIKFPIPNASTTTTSSSNESSLFKQFNNSNQPSATGTTTNSINKNLFYAKPKQVSSSNTLSFNLTSTNDASSKAIESNFFSPENLFKPQLNPAAKPFESGSNQLISSQQLNSSITGALNSTTQNSSISAANNDDEENYVQQKPEVAHVEEDAVYSIKCKLFLKKSNSYVEKGVGTCYIKETNEEAGNQLLIRAENSLGTILLNIRLKQSIPIIATKNGLILSIPVLPSDNKNAPSETASFYLKVKNNEVRDELHSFVKKYSV